MLATATWLCVPQLAKINGVINVPLDWASLREPLQAILHILNRTLSSEQTNSFLHTFNFAEMLRQFLRCVLASTCKLTKDEFKKTQRKDFLYISGKMTENNNANHLPQPQVRRHFFVFSFVFFSVFFSSVAFKPYLNIEAMSRCMWLFSRDLILCQNMYETWLYHSTPQYSLLVSSVTMLPASNATLWRGQFMIFFT